MAILAPVVLWTAGGLVTLGALAGSQVKDAADSVFKEPGGGIPRPGQALFAKGDIIFWLLVAGVTLYVIDKGKKVL